MEETFVQPPPGTAQWYLADIPEDECSWDNDLEADDGPVLPYIEDGFQADEPEDDEQADSYDDGFDYYHVPEEGMLDECGYWMSSSENSGSSG